jgi:hypothetical protein
MFAVFLVACAGHRGRDARGALDPLLPAYPRAPVAAKRRPAHVGDERRIGIGQCMRLAIFLSA